MSHKASTIVICSVSNGMMAGTLPSIRASANSRSTWSVMVPQILRITQKDYSTKNDLLGNCDSQYLCMTRNLRFNAIRRRSFEAKWTVILFGLIHGRVQWPAWPGLTRSFCGTLTRCPAWWINGTMNYVFIQVVSIRDELMTYLVTTGLTADCARQFIAHKMGGVLDTLDCRHLQE